MSDNKEPPTLYEDEEAENADIETLERAIADGGDVAAARDDTPMMRVTIDMMELNELDNQLVLLRNRRLERSNALRALMQQRRDNTMRTEMARFERIIARVRKMLDKAEAEEVKLATEMNKLRALAAAMEI